MRRPETKTRARALQLLYAWEVSGQPALDRLAARLAALCGPPPGRDYEAAAALAARAVRERAALDRRLAGAAEHWRLERLGVVERNILRLALAELERDRTPPRVVIDEAVQLAHWFAGGKAPAFVNGVLDRLARELGRL